MTNKFTYDSVKKFIEIESKSGCKLLSNDYKNVNEKLEIQCKCGNIFKTSFNTFKRYNKRQCNECGFNARNEKLKLTLDEVKNNVKLYNPNIKILSDRYISNRIKLKCKCLICEHEWEESYSNIQCGRGCPKCSKRYKPSVEEVKQEVTNKGYIPLFNEYKNNHSDLLCKDKNGYMFITNLIRLRSNNSFELFHKSNPYTIHNIKNYIKINKINTKLISKEYKGAKEKLEWECSCGDTFLKSWGDFYSEQSYLCKKCSLKLKSGVNHPFYNPNLTDEERTKSRNELYGNKQSSWAKKVYEKDGYRCVICGSKHKINAHHLDNWSEYKDKRFDINNGITLCNECHKEFHHLYGYKNNTKEQFYEWLIDIGKKVGYNAR